MIGIYKIENLNNGKIYIGSTVDYESRKRSHFQSLKNGRHMNKSMQTDFDNGDILNMELLNMNCTVSNLDKYENYYIGKFDTIESGYNKDIASRCDNLEITKTQAISQLRWFCTENGFDFNKYMHKIIDAFVYLNIEKRTSSQNQDYDAKDFYFKKWHSKNNKEFINLD